MVCIHLFEIEGEEKLNMRGQNPSKANTWRGLCEIVVIEM